MADLRPADSHLAREVAESFGSDAERYDRARPSYPDDLIERVLAEAPGTRILDVGTGTGAGTGAGHAYDALLDKAADGMHAAGGFGEPRRWRFEWDLDYSRDAWLDQVPTSGLFSRIDPDRRRVVLDGIGEVIDRAGGRFTMHWTTVAIAAHAAG